MKERILIVEDDEAIVKVLKRALAYEGYQVDAALDGESGLSLARDHHPDATRHDGGREQERRLPQPVPELSQGAPVLVVSHGLEGSSSAAYVRGLASARASYSQTRSSETSCSTSTGFAT